MNFNHRYSGKTRVNKYFNHKKNNKNRKQFQTSTKVVIGNQSLKKLFELQNELFQEDFSLKEYEEYIQEKIDDNMYHYRKLSKEDVDTLVKRFKRMIQKEDNYYSRIDDERSMREKQRKLFTERKANMINERKSKLIEELLKELRSCNSIGINKVDSLTSNPDYWNNITKKFLFTGKTYLEKNDKKWTKIYKKLVGEEYLLFDCHSKQEMYKLIYSS
tara:strand:- start:50 stop:700 length:651 start_codon:yes stop_codon:yes gene_type:complete